jgi:hypothetical protein
VWPSSLSSVLFLVLIEHIVRGAVLVCSNLGENLGILFFGHRSAKRKGTQNIVHEHSKGNEFCEDSVIVTAAARFTQEHVTIPLPESLTFSFRGCSEFIEFLNGEPCVCVLIPPGSSS